MSKHLNDLDVIQTDRHSVLEMLDAKNQAANRVSLHFLL
jgi:hypothetical protein